MKITRGFLFMSVVCTVLVLGVAYAAIQNVTLTVSGTATATSDQGNFDVTFTGTPTVAPLAEGHSGSGTLVIDQGSLTATMNVSGFKKIGDTVKATITVTNNSTDLGTTLVASKSAVAEKLGDTNLTKSEYFEVVSAELDTTTLAAGESTTLTILVKLVKVPVSADVTATFNVTVVATPVN